MITISLDEQGVFEHNNEQNDGIVMIAGIIYDDHGDPDDAEREKTRIRKYFMDVCDSFKAPYPMSLHFGGGKTNKYVASVKGEYSRTLGEFLKKGSYKGKSVPSDDGKERSGEYYVFAHIKSPAGKPELSAGDISNLINEDYASNLYMHMVEDVISRILFFNNRFLDMDSVSLDLATRIYKGEVGEDISEHTSLGYNDTHAKDGDIVYLTNSDVFRTALAREMLYETENDILIKSLEARSINYYKTDPGLEFLYLSDAICTCIGFQNTYKQNSYIAKSWDRMEKLAGDNRLLFLYDEVDTGFTKAWKHIDSGNIYKGLSAFYDYANKNTKEACFYKKQWEKELLVHVSDRVDTSSFTTAVRQFAQSTRNNDLKPNKLVFIFEALVSLKETIQFSNPQDKSVLYDLYDAGAAAYNHIGDSDKARECIALCKSYVKYVGVERELRNRNKYVVSLCDSLDFQKATKIAKETHEYYDRIFEIQKSIYGDDNANINDFGIIKSQLGQCYAFLNDNNAEQYFKEAMDLFDKGTPDYYQTESYLLHYLAQTENRSQYLVYENEYFGGHDKVLEQLEYIVNEGLKKSNPLISLRFALFVFVKGIFKFHIDDISNDDLDKLIHFEDTLKAVDPRVEEHIEGYPWVLIYKYLALICVAKDSVMSKEYVKKIKISKSEAPILDLIKQLSIYNVALAIEDIMLIRDASQRALEDYDLLQVDAEQKVLKDIHEINASISFIYH